MDMKTRTKKAMVMAEVLLALFLCGILMTIAICMFKSSDIAVTPHIYSVLKNLPRVNKIIMDECFEEGRCSAYNKLPSDLTEYCTKLSEVFVTSGEINCTNGGSTSTKLNAGGENSGLNFKLTNGVAFYKITQGNWKTLETGGTDRNYIDIYIDVNGARNDENKLGKDVFRLRIFENGEVIPTDDNDVNSHLDDEFFAYRAILNRALDDTNVNSRVEEVLEQIDNEDRNQKDDMEYRNKFSFQEAICLTNPSHIKHYFGKEAECEDIDLHTLCDFRQSNDNNPYRNDKSAYCRIEPVKPKGAGIFKIFGI